VAYRALVRSKVACLLVEDGLPMGQEATALLDHCARHLYLGRVQMILVGGTPGTGKSTVAEGLGGRLGCVVLRSDQVRKELAGLAGSDRAVAAYHVGLYAPRCTDATYAEMLRRAEVALARGETVVLDATWSSGEQRERARRVATASHAEAAELRCASPPELADARLAARLVEGSDASDATAEVAARLRAAFDPWPSARVVETTASVDVTLNQALGALGAPTLLLEEP
jgi:uncharacterized protein